MELDSQNMPTPSAEESSRPPLIWPLVILIGLTALLFFTDLDIAIADSFHDPETGFVWQGTIIGSVLHETCSVIVVLFVVYCLVVLLGSPWSTRLRTQRTAAAFLGICLLLGPGLIVNLIFKGHYGRPRPFQVERYGGDYEFQRVWVPSSNEGAAGFPSGDASIGAFLALPAFVLWRRRRRLAWGFLGLGVAGWMVLGFSRLAMGAHWTSDILWSAGFVYLTGHLVYWLFRRARPLNP